MYCFSFHLLLPTPPELSVSSANFTSFPCPYFFLLYLDMEELQIQEDAGGKRRYGHSLQPPSLGYMWELLGLLALVCRILRLFYEPAICLDSSSVEIGNGPCSAQTWVRGIATLFPPFLSIIVLLI